MADVKCQGDNHGTENKGPLSYDCMHLNELVMYGVYIFQFQLIFINNLSFPHYRTGPS